MIEDTEHSTIPLPVLAVVGMVSPRALLAYRAVLFLYCLGIGSWQVYLMGFHTFKYFTMWSWWLLTAYFGAAALVSWRALGAGRGRKVGAKVGRLEYAVIAMLHTLLPAVLLVDVLTWSVLVPMLLANPDPERVAWAKRMFFRPLSYNTHGANAAFALGELLLSAIPFHPYLGGYLGLYAGTFGVWAFSHFKLTGLWLYPFLDANKPWSVPAYCGVYVACWLFFGLVTAQFLLRNTLIRQLHRPQKKAA